MRSKRPFRLYPYFYQHQQAFYPGWKQIVRDPLTSLTTILVIGLAWALPAILLVILENIQQISPSWKNSTQISVYLKPQLPEAEIQTLIDGLRSSRAIEKVQYISSQEGLAFFSTHTGFKPLLEGLDHNPLPAVLRLQPTSQTPEQTHQLIAQLTQLPQAEYIKSDLTWLQRFYAIVLLGKRVAYTLAFLFSFGVLLLISHTIHLATQEQRKEIEVYQLVGATDHFIRRPFLYMGVIYGFLGALTALGLLQTLLLFLKAPVQKLAYFYQSYFKLHGLNVFQMLFLFGISITLCWIASWIAVHQEQQKN